MSNDDCPVGFAPSPAPPQGSGLTALYHFSGCQLNENGGGGYCCPECPVCFEVLGRGISMQLACGHRVHQNCFQLTNANGEGRCPECRQTEAQAMRMWDFETSDDEQNVELEVDIEPLPEPDDEQNVELEVDIEPLPEPDDEHNFELEVDIEPLPEPDPEHLDRLRLLEQHGQPEPDYVFVPEPEQMPHQNIQFRDVILNGPCPVDMPAVFGNAGIFETVYNLTPDRFENGRALMNRRTLFGPGGTYPVIARPPVLDPMARDLPLEWPISEVVVDNNVFKQYIVRRVQMPGTNQRTEITVAREWF
jgi:hypothetical protein